MRSDRTLLAGIFLLCFANLLLEVVITRLFSATMFYHFTFLAVALALFGIAASGVYVFVRGEALAADVRGHMARAARRFAVASLVAVAYAMANPIDIIIVTGSNAIPQFTARQVWQLAFLVGFTAVPFFFAGMVVSLALTFFRDTGRVYAWDLAGAALAALVTGLVLSAVGGPTAVLVAITVALVAAALFDTGRLRWAFPVAGVVLIGWNLAAPFLVVPTAKGVKAEAVRFEKWNAFSRVTVDTTNTIKIDASAATHVSDLATLRPGMHQGEISALAHSMFAAPGHTVLIIGPGGGRDVLHALSAGASKVTGVEVNPIIANDIMKEHYFTVSNKLYADPRVNIVVDDGRSFVRRSEQRYDVVQASLVDTWAATAAGAFALTENALYTVEAFEDYLAHTTDDGVVTMTRWHTGPRSESARLLLLAAAALEELGVPAGKARQHIFYATHDRTGLGTLILKRKPFTPDELQRLGAACVRAGFKVDTSPATDGQALMAKMLDAGPYSDFVASMPDELSPPTDDRPFFFYFKRLGDLLRPTGLMNDPGLWILLSLGLVVLLSAAFVIAPLVLHWRRARPAVETQGRNAVLAYFALVGFAFMVVEIAMLQRFTLFLGHPSYSLLVILFSVLLTTAIGAHFSTRFAPVKAIPIAGITIAVLAVFGAFGLPPILRSLIELSLAVRVVLTVLLVTPAGLAMGFMIPSLIRVLTEARNPLVPWGWGVNGATSVIGTVIATVVAIYAGFSTTFILGAVCYVAAGVLGRRIASTLKPAEAEVPAA